MVHKTKRYRPGYKYNFNDMRIICIMSINL